MDYEVTACFTLDGKEYFKPGEVITEDDPKIVDELLTKKLIKKPPVARKISEPKPSQTLPAPIDKPDDFTDLESVTPELAAQIKSLGIVTLEQLELVDPSRLTEINGVDLVLAETIIKEAKAEFAD